MCVFFHCYALSYEMDIFFGLKLILKIQSAALTARKHLHWDCARHLVKNVSVRIDFGVDCWFWYYFSFTHIHTFVLSHTVSVSLCPCLFLTDPFLLSVDLEPFANIVNKIKVFSQLFNVKSEQHILRNHTSLLQLRKMSDFLV